MSAKGCIMQLTEFSTFMGRSYFEGLYQEGAGVDTGNGACRRGSAYHVQALTPAQMQSAAGYAGFDFGSTWVIEPDKNAGLPYFMNVPLLTGTSDPGGDNPGGGNTTESKRIFSTNYDATPLNWILFFVCFGFIWMWF